MPQNWKMLGLARLAHICQAVLLGLADICTSSFARTCRHSQKVIFEKNLTLLAKFARVMIECGKWCASGHCLFFCNLNSLKKFCSKIRFWENGWPVVHFKIFFKYDLISEKPDSRKTEQKRFLFFQ
jgi:hypothetical protein